MRLDPSPVETTILYKIDYTGKGEDDFPDVYRLNGVNGFEKLNCDFNVFFNYCSFALRVTRLGKDGDVYYKTVTTIPSNPTI